MANHIGIGVFLAPRRIQHGVNQPCVWNQPEILECQHRIIQAGRVFTGMCVALQHIRICMGLPIQEGLAELLQKQISRIWLPTHCSIVRRLIDPDW